MFKAKRKKSNSTLEYARRMARILYAIEYLGRYCEICKFDGFLAPWLLDFHHRDESTKKYEVKNKLYGGSFNRHKEELDKCMLLCVSCHRNNHVTIAKYQEHQTIIFEKLDEIRKNGNGKIAKNKSLTDEKIDSILRMIEDGYIMPEISKKLEINYGTIKNFIKMNDIEVKKRSRVKIPWSIVIKMLNTKHSMRNIAKKLNIDREALRLNIHDNVTCEMLDNGVKIYKKIDPENKNNQISNELIFEKGKLSEKQVIQINELYKTEKYTYSDLARMFNVKTGAIQKIITGKSWKYIEK